MKNGNNEKMATEIVTQAMKPIKRKTKPQQVLFQITEMSIQQIISSSVMNSMMKEVMKMNNIMERIRRQLLLKIGVVN